MLRSSSTPSVNDNVINISGALVARFMTEEDAWEEFFRQLDGGHVVRVNRTASSTIIQPDEWHTLPGVQGVLYISLFGTKLLFEPHSSHYWC